jgi:hypothetical protein
MGEMFQQTERASGAKESWYFGTSNECAAMRALVKTTLMHPLDFRWTVQGFGMLRTYLGGPEYGKRFRLNVWDSTLAVPGVSIIHDHPWDFDSWIINGQFRNVRYVADEPADRYERYNNYMFMVIKCGEDGCSVSDPQRIRLRALPIECYVTGDKYHQNAAEIHASYYSNGTVTLNDRVGDTEHAKVFWVDKPGAHWVDAKPREASPAEVEYATRLALDRWE